MTNQEIKEKLKDNPKLQSLREAIKKAKAAKKCEKRGE